MASQMATPSYTPEAHEEVDFMSMFMSQQTSDDMGAQEQQQPQYTMPALPASDPIQVFDSLPVDMSTHAYGMYEPYAPIPAPIPAPAQYKIEQPTPRPATAPSTVATPYSQPAAPSTPPPAIQTQQSLVSSPTAIESTSNLASPVTTEAAAEPARQPGRRKRKLTPEDKRRICEIYRNSQGKIRQEDIAKEYSVDRSTISKILNQEERWLDPDAPGANALLARRPGGRYPAIEEEMHRWLDEAVMHGREIRDSEAREEALRIGLRLGHPHFQASSKWWDGVKRRRAEEGRPMPTARRHALTPPMGMPGLVRSYSAMGMDPYPRDMFPAMGVAGPSQYFIPSHMQPYPAAIRSRSQSSPQVIPAAPGSYASQPSSFGPAPRQRFSPGRHANAAALRQWTFPNANGASPGRPMSRNGSSQGPMMGAPSYGTIVPPQVPNTLLPTSELAPPDMMSETGSMHVPALSQSSGMSPLSIAISESEAGGVAPLLSPDSPRTPAHANFAHVPMAPMSTECVDYTNNPYGQYTQAAVYNPQATACLPEQQFAQPHMYPGYEFVQPQW